MKQFLFAVSIFVLVAAFDENALLEDAKKKVSEGLDQLPDNVKQIIPKELPEIPSVEEGEELLKKRCDTYGTNTSFDRAMEAKEDVQFCLRGLVDFSEMQKEIEQAKPTGDLDTVFRKYCRKSPQLRGCVTNFTEAIEPCLSPTEKDSKQTITNITDALISFICFKEGDRIALFIAEGGPDCLKSKQDEIQQCLNSSFSSYIPKEMPNKDDELPLFSLGQKECGDVTKLQKCVVGHLEKCSEPTPANIVDSMFTFVRKYTPCQQYETSGTAPATLSLSLFALSTLLLLATAHSLH